MTADTIISVEYGTLTGERPRAAGSNARLGSHGRTIRLPLLRLTTRDGVTGFGPCYYATREQIHLLLGCTLHEFFEPPSGLGTSWWLPLEFALWDLRARREQKPLYALLGNLTARPVPVPYRVPCYDTSLYIDDLHLSSDAEAGELIAAEAREGHAAGHRAFKIKIGRGARHMPLAEGTRRDIAVIRAVRAALGPDAVILLDANNGYNLNLAKSVLAEVADCTITWLEEPFHEDPVLYRNLHDWLRQHGSGVLIADGEGDASPRLLDWAGEGLVDVLQYDIYSHGISRWLATGLRIERHDARTAPHHYGSAFGNYAACHLAAGLPHFAYVEWDEAHVPGLEAPGYTIADGLVSVPPTPGFGLVLDDVTFAHAVAEGGFAQRL
jgi:L-alanine-DL-glutamate epimerase-like enolase superfamily enzyme